MALSQSHNSKKILVLGAGNFGTCLAHHLAEKGYKVTLWARSDDVVRAINTTHKNPKYLSEITLSSGLSATSNLGPETFADLKALVVATPTQSLRAVLSAIKPYIKLGHLIICAAKGVELGSLLLPLQVIGSVLGDDFADHAVVLSGPSFASEVVIHQPTAVTAASRDIERATDAQSLFHTPYFRVYTSRDPVGLEVAGALKNVVAIATGAAGGLGVQMNGRAALITRGLAEITRVGVALGASPLTFKGLGGVGDLFLTCTSEKSRNYSLGQRLGRGEALDLALKEVGVAEGVSTAKAAFELITKLGVDAPIISEVYQVLYEKKPILNAVNDLMTREAKPELDQPVWA
jgi:glycerol-3-phosphate dehydrogenase